jgi:hypothetical protein
MATTAAMAAATPIVVVLKAAAAAIAAVAVASAITAAVAEVAVVEALVAALVAALATGQFLTSWAVARRLQLLSLLPGSTLSKAHGLVLSSNRCVNCVHV